MDTIYTPNPNFQGNSESLEKLNDAIDSAIFSNPQLSFEYSKYTFKLHLAGLLRSLRVEADLTQAGLAEKAGFRQSFIARLENPDANKEPTLETLEKIANVLGKKLVIDFQDLGNSNQKSQNGYREHINTQKAAI